MIEDKKIFKVAVISLFGLDFGAYAVGAYTQSKGYPVYNIQFNQLKIPREFMANDYFTVSKIDHDLFPANDLQLLLKTLEKIKPKVIGISVSSVCFQTACWMTKAIRQKFDALIVWGGIHAVIAPEECLDHADIVCKGEGEQAFFEIIENLRNKRPINKINNTMLRSDSILHDNPMRLLIENLDCLPFPDRFNRGSRFFIDQGKVVENPAVNAGYMMSAYPMMSSRGCMYSCSFCSNSIISKQYAGLGTYLRRRSVDHVIDELKHAVGNGHVGSVRFWDDIFTYDEKWIDIFCQAYQKHIAKPFICYAHPKHTKRSVLKKLAKVGLTAVYVGIQSGSDNTNKNFFNRRQSNQEIADFLRYAQQLKVSTTFDLIVDNIFETEEDDFNTSELLMQLPKPYQVLIFSLCFFPKTPLTNSAIEKRLISKQQTEQYTAKALNNFFMVIPKSANKKHEFWNCIKGMAVNRYFSGWFIKLCRQNSFFKKYPRVLFLIGKTWIKLFKSIGKQKQKDFLLPLLIENLYIDDYIVWEGNKQLYQEPKNSIIAFRADKSLHLGIRGKHKQVFEGLEIDMYPLNSANKSTKDRWRLNKQFVFSQEHDLRFEIDYPEVVCFINGKRLSLARRSAQISKLMPNEPYLIRIKKIIKGNHIPGKKNKYFIAASLFDFESKDICKTPGR